MGLNSHTFNRIKSLPSANFWRYQNKQGVDEIQKIPTIWPALKIKFLNTGRRFCSYDQHKAASMSMQGGFCFQIYQYDQDPHWCTQIRAW